MKLTSYGKIQTQGQGFFMIKVAIIEDEKNEQERIKQLLDSNGGGITTFFRSSITEINFSLIFNMVSLI